MIFSDLKGKIAIVTGASRRQGIGAAICRAFASQGTHVFFTGYAEYDKQHGIGFDEGGTEALLEELRECGIKAEYLEVDLSNPEAAQFVLDETNARLGEPDILLNNAAYSSHDGYENLNADILDAHYAINMRATFLLSVGFAKQFKRAEGGRIINLSSGQSLAAMTNELAYVATKGAIEAFTLTLAEEVAALGITVNAVDPGGTDTGWMTEAQNKAWSNSMKMGRLGLPTDIARLIVFLASDAGQWITGQVIHSRGA